MTRKKIIVFSLFLIINSSNLFGFNNEIIPKPDSQILSTGEFILSEKTKINYNGSFKISWINLRVINILQIKYVQVSKD